MTMTLFWEAHEELQAWLDAWRPLPESSPLVVYSMRKVGSTTLTAALRAQGHKTYKQHCLVDGSLAELESLRKAAGLPPQEWVRSDLRFSRRLARWRTHNADARTPGRLKIITFVKDPVAVAISDFFMHCFELLPPHRRPPGLDDPARLDALLLDILQCSSAGDGADGLRRYLGLVCRLPQHWFETELRPLIGVDPASASASTPQVAGSWLFKGADADVALLRSDLLDLAAPWAMEQLIGRRLGPMPWQNVAGRSKDGDTYRRLLERIRLPQPLVDRLFAPAWLSCFYSADELRSMKRRWVVGLPASLPGQPGVGVVPEGGAPQGARLAHPASACTERP